MLSFRPWCGPFGWLESRKFFKGKSMSSSMVVDILYSVVRTAIWVKAQWPHRPELGYSASDFIRAVDAVRGCCCLGIGGVLREMSKVIFYAFSQHQWVWLTPIWRNPGSIEAFPLLAAG